jgi:hypothetical protein
MRLALIGPGTQDAALAGAGLLRKSAELLLGSLGADRVVYLGADDGFERMVAEWSQTLAPRGEAGVWADVRALLAVEAPARRAETWLKEEDARKKLRRLEVLPRANRMTIEMLGTRMAILVDDHQRLRPDEAAEAQIIIFGSAPAPRARVVAEQWLVSPGELTEESGLATIEETGDSLRVTFYDPNGKVQGGETLKAFNKTKFSVKQP